jgi:hypothetical protein
VLAELAVLAVITRPGGRPQRDVPTEPTERTSLGA